MMRSGRDSFSYSTLINIKNLFKKISMHCFKKKNATKLSDQLKPLFYVNIFFGLPSFYKKTNFIFYLYSISLFIFIPIYIFHTLFKRAKAAKSSKTPGNVKVSISSIMNYVQVQLVVTVVYFIYVRNFTRRFIFQYVIQHIELVDEKLQKIFQIQSESLKIATIAQLPVIMIYGSTQGINIGYKLIVLKRTFVQAFMTSFVNTLLFLIMFQLVLYSKILKNRFNKLNAYLLSLVTSNVFTQNGTLTSKSTPPASLFKTHEQLDHILNVKSIYDINYKLKQLIILHYELNKICDALNDSYNVQITIVIAVTVLGVASMLQTTTSNMINYFYKNANILMFILYVAFWISLGLICLFWLISNISSMQNEGNLSPKLAHKLMLERHEFRDQIELFTKVVQVKKVEFTACKLFPINHSLVFAILGATTTYWAILIQFQLQLNNS